MQVCGWWSSLLFFFCFFFLHRHYYLFPLVGNSGNNLSILPSQSLLFLIANGLMEAEIRLTSSLCQFVNLILFFPFATARPASMPSAYSSPWMGSHLLAHINRITWLEVDGQGPACNCGLLNIRFGWMRKLVSSQRCKIKPSPCPACRCFSASFVCSHKQMLPDQRGGRGRGVWSLTCLAGERLKSICCAFYAEHFNSSLSCLPFQEDAWTLSDVGLDAQIVLFFFPFLSSTSNTRLHGR